MVAILIALKGCDSSTALSFCPPRYDEHARLTVTLVQRLNEHREQSLGQLATRHEEAMSERAARHERVIADHRTRHEEQLHGLERALLRQREESRTLLEVAHERETELGQMTLQMTLQLRWQ